MDNYKEYLDPADGYALVKQSVNMPVHPNWIEIPEDAELYVYWRKNDTYNFQVDKSYFENGSWLPCAWTIEEIKSDKAGAKILWSRKPKEDPALISGADVPRLIKEGNQIQLRAAIGFKLGEWKDLDLERDEEELTLGDLINSRFEWRLKPQTIKLELELPKPFEPKEDGYVYIIDDYQVSGYRKYYFEVEDNKELSFIGVWHTEDEIKQVVAQLRKIRGAS